MHGIKVFEVTSRDVRLGVFIAFAAVFALLFLFLFFRRPFRRWKAKRNITKAYYPKVYKTALHGDYYLINDFNRGEGPSKIHIDHIVGGNKFIYVISDYYFDGAISGMGEDASWVYYSRRGRKTAIQNPLAANRYALNRLSTISGINSSFMVGIVLVNEECFVSRQDKPGDGESRIISLSGLERLIEEYEGKDVTSFVAKELWQAIHDLHELGKDSQ